MHYWATAEDNKEPRPNHSETEPPRTIRIVAQRAGRPARSAEPAASRRRSTAAERRRISPSKAVIQDKSEKGQGDSIKQGSDGPKGDAHFRREARWPGASEQVERSAARRQQGPGPAGQQRRSRQGENVSRPGQRSEERRTEIRGRPAISPTKFDPETQKADVHQEVARRSGRSKRKNNRTNPTSPNGDKKPDQKPDPGQQSDNQQGNPQPDGQKQEGDQGGQPRRATPAKRKTKAARAIRNRRAAVQQSQGNQGAGSEPAQPAAPGRATESRRSRQSEAIATAGQFRRSSSNGALAAARQQGRPAIQSSTAKRQAARATNRTLRPARKKARIPPGRRSPIRSRAVARRGSRTSRSNLPATAPKSEKPQPGSQQGKDETAKGGNPPNAAKPQPGEQGRRRRKPIGPRRTEARQQEAGWQRRFRQPEPARRSEARRQTQGRAATFPARRCKVRKPSRKEAGRRRAIRWRRQAQARPRR